MDPIEMLKNVEIPEEARCVLLEFVLAYLLDHPENIIDYACEYFWRLRETKNVHICDERVSLTEFKKAACHTDLKNRRRSVFAEVYDPTEVADEKIIHPKTDEQHKKLRDSLKHIFLFRSLQLEDLQSISDAMYELPVKEGEVIIRQGDEGDNFYIIQGGKFEAAIKKNTEEEECQPEVIKVYEDEGCFGELALLYNAPRAATITAKSDGILWALDRLSFKRIVYQITLNKRRRHEEFIARVPILQELKPYERLNVIDALIPKECEADEKIFSEGDNGDGMYFVESGQIVITKKDSDGNDLEIDRKTEGHYFGELALITNRPRAATAFAATPCKLVFLDKGAFERLLGPCVQIMKRNIENYRAVVENIFKESAVKK